MAHGDSRRREARKRYVSDRQALSVIAITMGVPDSTLRRWKRAAKADGDDWDAAQAANTVSGAGFDALLMEVINDYVIQHKAAIEGMREAKLEAADKARILASLADSFNKTLAAAGRLAPEISRLAVAMDVLQRFGEHIARAQDDHPELVTAFMAQLEAFGETLPGIYK